MAIPTLANLQNVIASAGNRDGSGIFGSWQFLDHSDKERKPVCTFTSFYSFTYDADSKTTSYPIEGGSFFTYNKQADPFNCTVTLIKDGINLPYQKKQFLDVLDKYLREPLTVDIITPSAAYINCNIETMSYKQNPDDGADLLFVTMKIKEIRELKAITGESIAVAPADSNTASTEKRGLTVPQKLNRFVQEISI